MAKPQWFSRYGIALALVSIAAMSSIFLTMQASSALRGELHLHGEAATLISEHSQAAGILAIVFTAFNRGADRRFRRLPDLRRDADRPRHRRRLLGSRSTFAALRILLVVLAIGAGFITFRTGDLGEKAVWAHRLEAAGARP
jgi:hypothetical protein